MRKNHSILALAGLIAAIGIVACGGGGSTGVCTSNCTPPPPEDLAVTCVDHVQGGVVDAALKCAATKSGATYTGVSYALDVASTVASIADDGTITAAVLSGPTQKVTVTVTDSTTGTTATTTFQIVSWLLGTSTDAHGNTTVGITNADGSGTVALMTSTCTMPKWLHSRLGFTCITSAGAIQVYSTDGTASGTKLTMTLPLSGVTAISAAAASPDGKTAIFEGRAQENDGEHYGVYGATLADGTTATTLLESDEVCQQGCTIPDGPNWNESQTEIVYSHISGSNGFVYTMPAAGGEGVQLAAGAVPVFSTDKAGSTVFYAGGGGISSIPSTGGTAQLVIPGVGNVAPSSGNAFLAVGTETGIDIYDLSGKQLASLPTQESASLSW